MNEIQTDSLLVLLVTAVFLIFFGYKMSEQPLSRSAAIIILSICTIIIGALFVTIITSKTYTLYTKILGFVSIAVLFLFWGLTIVNKRRLTFMDKQLIDTKTLQVIETRRGRNVFKCDMNELWGSAVEAEFLVEILFDYKQISSLDNIQRSSVLAISVNNNSVEDAGKIIDIAQPRVLLLLSDEFGDKPEYEELFSKVPLVYRQYRYDSYKNPPNQRILPVGYHCWDQHARRPSMTKKYVWSFIGNLKGNREKDIKVLDDLKPNFNGKTKPEENPDILNSSIFVYCPNGNYNVESSRPYTASMCGAIPCLVCTQSQWDSTYPYFDIEPPWLHADSAEKIRDMMKSLLENPVELRRLQHAVSKWWVDMKRAVYKNINDIVTGTLPNESSKRDPMGSLYKMKEPWTSLLSQGYNFLKDKEILHHMKMKEGFRVQESDCKHPLITPEDLIPNCFTDKLTSQCYDYLSNFDTECTGGGGPLPFFKAHESDSCRPINPGPGPASKRFKFPDSPRTYQVVSSSIVPFPECGSGKQQFFCEPVNKLYTCDLDEKKCNCKLLTGSEKDIYSKYCPYFRSLGSDENTTLSFCSGVSQSPIRRKGVRKCGTDSGWPLAPGDKRIQNEYELPYDDSFKCCLDYPTASSVK